MAVTKQVYTAAATWTAATLANTFRSAFIDAGLMTEWFDSFTNTVENRVLEVQYSGAATYGKTYYWFMFTTGGVYVTLATGWNATTKVPTGTQYLDYFSTTTNVVTNHVTLMNTVATTSLTVTRYSSGATAGFSWFLVQNGATNFSFSISRASVPLQSWVDLNKGFFHNFSRMITGVVLNSSNAIFSNVGGLRRSFHLGTLFIGATAVSQYTTATISSGGNYLTRYTFPGKVSGNTVDGNGGVSALHTGVILPVLDQTINPAAVTNSNPIYTNLPYHPLINETLPSDFGLAVTYPNNTMAVGDTFTVTAGTEVWEILSAGVGNGSTIGSAMFLARTT